MLGANGIWARFHRTRCIAVAGALCAIGCTSAFDRFHRAPPDAGFHNEAGVKDASAHLGDASTSSKRRDPSVDASMAGQAGTGGAGHDASVGSARDAGTVTMTDSGSPTANSGTADPCVPSPCGANMTCAPQTKKPGYACSCADGFKLDGTACTDIDECADGTHTCHPSATCKNTPGSFDCTCPLGYAGGTPAGFACTPRIAVGQQHTCALLTSGHVMCWGDNSKGQLGDGTMTNSTSPVGVSGLAGVVGIEAGPLGTCALLDDRTVWCWGYNGSSSHVPTTPELITGLTEAVMVSTDNTHGCAVRANGRVSCWGSATGGALGNGQTSNVVFDAADVGGVSDAVHVSTGGARTCATRKDGTVLCWGAPLLGNGSMSSSLVPVMVSNLHDAIATDQAYIHACALRANGYVACWGQAGLDGSTTTSSDGGTAYDLSPVTVMSGCRAIGLDLYDSCVLLASGTVSCWGSSAASAHTPMPISGLTNAVAIVPGGIRNCAILTDGTIYCFGVNRAVETVPNIVLW